MSGAKSYNRGKTGENIACEHLQSIGHKIISRNFRADGGEIDVISLYENKLYFSEVKTRKLNSMVEIEESITYDKKNRLQRAAMSFLAQNYNYDTEAIFLFIFIVLTNNGEIKKIDIFCDSL